MNEKKKIDFTDLFWNFMAVWLMVFLTLGSVGMLVILFRSAFGENI